MKKLRDLTILRIVLLISLIFMFSCDDECIDTYEVYKKIESRSTEANALIIFEDTCLESAGEYSVIQIRNNAVLTLTGDDVVVQASITFTDGGTLNIENSLIIGNDIFFLGEGAVVNVGGGIVLGHAVDQGDLGGEINYCVFASIQILDPGIIDMQDCSIEFENCQTLSDTDFEGYTYWSTLDLPCDTKDSDEYKYIKR